MAAIDVGTNAVRLEIARVHSDGELETLHQERSAIRPGEGMTRGGGMPKPVADRLLATLRRYGALCRRHGAKLRAVATSAVREAKNRDELVRRAREEAGVALEVVSGREEARLICLGVLHGKSERQRSLVIDIGGGSTEVAVARGDRPEGLWSVALGSVRLTELFSSEGRVRKLRLKLMRDYAREIFEEAIPRSKVTRLTTALGSSGTIQAVVDFAAERGTREASLQAVSKATREIAAMGTVERARHFEPHRAEIIVAGAVILEQVMIHLGLRGVRAVDRGLRDGLLIELGRKARADDRSVAQAALALAERFSEDLGHPKQVAKLASSLFDQLAALHRLPAASRPILEAAALLHDIGHAVSYQRHHRHSLYLIRNADIPGLAEEERERVALVARFHRRSAPEVGHPDLRQLSPSEVRQLQKLSAILRLADSLDRGHHQAVSEVRARAVGGKVVVELRGRQPTDLELWDAEREAPLFRRVFSKRLELRAARR